MEGKDDYESSHTKPVGAKIFQEAKGLLNSHFIRRCRRQTEGFLKGKTNQLMTMKDQILK